MTRRLRHRNRSGLADLAQARALAGAVQSEAGPLDLQREWKKRVPLAPAALNAEVREWGMHLLPMLVNTLTGRNWFSGAWNLETVCTKARQWLPQDGSDARSS